MGRRSAPCFCFHKPKKKVARGAAKNPYIFTYVYKHEIRAFTMQMRQLKHRIQMQKPVVLHGYRIYQISILFYSNYSANFDNPEPYTLYATTVLLNLAINAIENKYSYIKFRHYHKKKL